MKTETLKDLEKQHGDALTRAESKPAGSPERRDAYREADAVAARINDWHERANPTP